MLIRILAVGRLKEEYWKQAQAEYSKRLSRYTELEIAEVQDERAPETLSDAQRETVKDAEGKRLLARHGAGDVLVALEPYGKQFSSEAFAAKLSAWMLAGKSRIDFAVGGSLGLSDEVRSRADLTLSFGPMTFPHQLFRLMLLEQIYRAFKINSGEPYHK